MQSYGFYLLGIIASYLITNIKMNDIIRPGHSDNQIGFGSGISDLGYFGYVKIGTNRVFIKLG